MSQGVPSTTDWLHVDDSLGGGVASGMPDLTSINLDELGALDNPVLASVLQGIRREAENPEEAVAGFQSSI
jgi:FXSXX-COOH protein